MIIVNLKGGLGNQMFQYAAGRRLAETTNQPLKLDRAFIDYGQKNAKVTVRQYELSVFNCLESFARPEEVKQMRNLTNQVLQKFFGNGLFNPYVKEKYFHFDSSILLLKGDCYLDGHWMSEKYFLDIENIIRKEFVFKNGLLPACEDLRSKILATNSVCIQVRRGDYVSRPEVAKVHNTTSYDYFYSAISLVRSRIQNPFFFIFSDDIQWCHEHFYTLKNVCFVEKELAQKGASTSDYLQLMTLCKYFIISNSTFAWWGAWLSSFEQKLVIAPKNWFNSTKLITKDIYPASWLKI